MKFDITKRLDLSYIDGWDGCYLEFAVPSYNDIKDIPETESPEKGFERMESLFRAGKGMSDGKQVEIGKDDLKDLPINIMNKAMSLIAGELDPKGNGNSTTA